MSNKNQPLIVELEQVHNCVGIEVCNKLEGLKLRWLATIGQDEKTVSGLFEISADNSKKAIKIIKSHKEVVDVQVAQSNPRTVQLIIRQKKYTSTAPLLAKAGVTWIDPVWSEADLDVITMMAPSFKNLKSFMDMASEKGYSFKIKSKRYLSGKESTNLDLFRTSGFTKLRAASELLTERQLEIFDLACRYGYYENPKKITIAELAERTGISSSTFAELLRKSERKLLPVLSEIIRILR